jgi:hypothetical protein
MGFQMTKPHVMRRMETVKAGSRAKQAAGLRYMCGRRFVNGIAPVAVPEEFRIREHADGIRSIMEVTRRRDLRTDREMRVSVPFVSIQHEGRM